ncbi:MAG: hypothetical protein OXT74_17040 [Candidatus Poribacteria bacterium]|nr:hypothetical protein [Candidatus Poribacteria bacterium]
MQDSHDVVVSMLAAIFLFGCGDDADVNPYMSPEEMLPLVGKLAFSSNRDGDSEIYLINADGTSLMQLTENDGVDYPGSWSPDGRKLAFVSDRTGKREIYVMEIDGSGSTIQLTDGPGRNGGALWSPDGQKIAYDSWSDGDGEIFVMDPDGTNLVQLTNNDINEYVYSWSPDSQKLAFSRTPKSIFNSDSEIFVMNADGSNATQLTDNDTFDSSPAWSPDGHTIAFTSRSATATWVKTGKNTHMQFFDSNIFLMYADDFEVRQLTYDNLSTGASWSPDGQFIAFVYGAFHPNFKTEIHVMDANGSRRRTLIDWPDSDEGSPTWQPSQ